MKIDVYDIQKVYRSFFEKQQYQIEVFQGLRAAIGDYAALESFQGETAENAKAYMADVHVSVVDSIEMALMELEIRLLTLKQDFNATVDSSDKAVVDDVYIGQLLEEIDGHTDTAETQNTDVTELISSVSDLITLTDPGIPAYIELMESTRTNGQTTLDNLVDFNTRHQDDMANVHDMFSAITSAVQFMAATENIGKYTAQSASETEWSKLMYTCQIRAYLYAVSADPNFGDTIYLEFAVQTGLTMLDALLPPDVDQEAVMAYLDLLADGKDLFEMGYGVNSATKAAADLFRFFRDGIRFAAQIDPTTGETVIKAVSVAGRALTRSQQVIALRAAGVATDVSRTTARSLAQSLFSANGLQVTGSNAYQLRGGTLDPDAITALTRAASAGEDASSFMRQFGRAVSEVSVLEWVMFGVSIVLDGVDACYDERTRQFAEFDPVEFASDAVMTTATFATPIIASAVAGSVVPGIGTAVGAGVGVVLSVLNFIEWGQPPKNVFDHTSDLIEDVIHDVGNWFSKVFW